MKKNDTRLIYSRIKLAYDIKTDRELAVFLGITPQVIPTSILRGTVQWDKIFQKCEYLSIDWLITGEGKMFQNSSEKSANSSEKCIEKMTNYIEMLEKENKKLNKELEEIKQNKPFTVAPGAGGSSLKKEIC